LKTECGDDEVDELKDIAYPDSDKITELRDTLAVQLPKCNYLHLYRNAHDHILFFH